MVEYFETMNDCKKAIRGIINVSNKEEKHPCFVLCHGFTGNKAENHFLFVKLARTLEKLGYCVVRFDFTGSGESDGDFIDMTFSTEIADCEKVLEYVKEISYVDSNKINILGFSMGGAVSIINSAKHLDVIKNTVLISPATDLFQVFSSSAKKDQFESLMEKGYININGLLLGKNALDDALKYDIFDYVKRMKQERVLVIQGTYDESVPPYSSKKVKDILGDKGELFYIEGSNHCYQAPEFDTKLINKIVEWCKTYEI